MAENEPSALKASDDETKNKPTSALGSSRDMDNLEERFSQQQVIYSIAYHRFVYNYSVLICFCFLIKGNYIAIERNGDS